MPEKLAWDTSYSVGSAALDAQHKKLLALCNALADCADDASPQADSKFHEVLNELAVYSRVHFTAEEKLLVRCNYPLLEKHKKEHAKFNELIAEKLVAAVDGTLEKVGLHRFLVDWWAEHILIKDMHYRDYLD